jgi:hypothetical protein
MSRDPRVDPRIGDVVCVRGRQRRVFYIDPHGRIGWITDAPRYQSTCTLRQWRKWAGQDGSEVVTRRQEVA